MNDYQELTLWLGATRYYLGRTTYAVDDFCQLLIGNWETFCSKTQELIRRDVEDAFQRDDEFRADNETRWLPLGDNCDRQSWERVRNLWRVE